MPTIQDVTSARTSAQAFGKTAGELEAGTFTVGDLLKEKATEAYGASQDIIQPLDVATQQYLGAPQEARVKYQDIFNPFARENLIQQYTSGKALPMLGLQSVLGQRFGGVGDIIEKGTGAYQAQATAAQSKAELARQLYGDVFGEYQVEESARQWQQEQDVKRAAAEEEKRRFEWERPYQERQYEYELKKPYYKPEAGGGDGLTDLLSLIFGQQGGGETGNPPPYTPQANGETAVDDETGVVWQYQDTQWVAVGRQ